MQLILLLVLFGVIGYMLAGSDFSDRVDRTSERASAASDKWVTRGWAWWRSRFSRGVSEGEFRSWVTGAGADSLPDDFREWYTSISKNEGQVFVNSLSNYADGLGYNLMKLVAGGLEQKPLMKQVFVEAIVVYSDAYRKAEETHQQDEDEASEEDNPESDAVKPAQKSASRRKRTKVSEAASAA